MKIHEQLQHAYEFGYPVLVTFKGCERQGKITEYGPTVFCMEPARLIHHAINSVVGVKLVERNRQHHRFSKTLMAEHGRPTPAPSAEEELVADDIKTVIRAFKLMAKHMKPVVDAMREADVI